MPFDFYCMSNTVTSILLQEKEGQVEMYLFIFA